MPSPGVSDSPTVEQFKNWCKDELFTAEMRRAAALLQRACDLHLQNLYRSLSLSRYLQNPKSSAELARDLGFVESASVALEAMLQRLAARTRVVNVQLSGHVPLFTSGASPVEDDGELEDIRRQLLDHGYGAAIEFLDFGAEYFVHSLRDDPEFMDRVLTGREARFQELWFRATNTDPLQDVHGIMGARWIELVFRSGLILEIGGGTGNGTRHLLHRFADCHRLADIESYIFSDVSLGFIMSTRKELREAYSGVPIEWRHVDINKPLGEQKLAPESLDLIFGVNAAHIARDIVGFIKQCRTMLRAGGRLVFAERVRTNVREMAPREIALNLSIYHRTAAMRDRDVRPLHGYLTPQGWLRALESAGFHDPQILPDFNFGAEEFPDQYAAVVHAAK